MLLQEPESTTLDCISLLLTYIAKNHKPSLRLPNEGRPPMRRGSVHQIASLTADIRWDMRAQIQRQTFIANARQKCDIHGYCRALHTLGGRGRGGAECGIFEEEF